MRMNEEKISDLIMLLNVEAPQINLLVSLFTPPFICVERKA